MVFGMQSVPQVLHNVVKFVSDLLQVGGFLRVIRFLPPIILTADIFLKMALNTMTLTLKQCTTKLHIADYRK